ncbi:MAG: hypothetical protein Q4A78_06075 [Peptostreptococcaceae bacterium]|nr:hypothetical protein [Peptostreptococcaceae bacterium]
MDNIFRKEEKLYRAVYPPSHPGLFWKKDGSLSSAAFADPKGLSVERGYDRSEETVIQKMRESFIGCIVSLKVKNCIEADALVKYLPTKNNEYHSEIHGGPEEKLLSRKQRMSLVKSAVIEHMEA